MLRIKKIRTYISVLLALLMLAGSLLCLPFAADASDDSNAGDEPPPAPGVTAPPPSVPDAGEVSLLVPPGEDCKCPDECLEDCVCACHAAAGGPLLTPIEALMGIP